MPAFRTDATCSVKPQSLIGEYFVDCQPGTARERLADGAAIPVTQTEGTIPIDLIQNVLRRPARERLRVLVAGLGTGLAGRSDDLQEVLRRLHPGMRETSKVLRILGDESRTIQRFIADADTVFTELAGSRRDARRFVTEGADLAETVASRRDGAARVGAPHARVPGRAAAVAGAPGRAGGRVRAAARRPPARRARPGERARPARAVRRHRAARAARAGQRRGARQPGAAGGQGRAGRAEPAGRGRSGHRQAAAPAAPEPGRPQTRDRQRPAREGRTARPRPIPATPAGAAASPASSRSATTSSGR